MARLSIARFLQAPRVISSALLLSAMFVTPGYAAPDERVQALARAEAAPLLTTLKDLVAIESGSGDREGLDKISALIHSA